MNTIRCSVIQTMLHWNIATAIATLQKKHNIQVEWNIFWTAHWKGPVDRIRGSALGLKASCVEGGVNTQDQCYCVVTFTCAYMCRYAWCGHAQVNMIRYRSKRNQINAWLKICLWHLESQINENYGITRMLFIKHLNINLSAVSSLLTTSLPLMRSLQMTLLL